jgi:hypothetical protein
MDPAITAALIGGGAIIGGAVIAACGQKWSREDARADQAALGVAMLEALDKDGLPGRLDRLEASVQEALRTTRWLENEHQRRAAKERRRREDS